MQSYAFAEGQSSTTSYLSTISDIESRISLSGARRFRRKSRSQNAIVTAILEACRTPTAQHWVMVKARLGYDTFKMHMSKLLDSGLMSTKQDEGRTLYYLSERGIELLQDTAVET